MKYDEVNHLSTHIIDQDQSLQLTFPLDTGVYAKL